MTIRNPQSTIANLSLRDRITGYFEATSSGDKVSMDPLETYLKELCDIRSTGAGDPETSYYGRLEDLFNEVGKALKPKVRCVISLTNAGAGKPDGGFFTTNQFQKARDPEPMKGQLPARGAVEVKPPSDDVRKIAGTKQVKGYSAKYGLILVTNYREFLLLGHDASGNPLPMEGFTLAADEKAFWAAAGHPQKTATEQGERFCEYLKRVMLASAPLSDPRDVAWFLASYARDAKVRVEKHKDLSALAAVRDALEEALGMKFTGDKGEHFFRSTLVQTIFYGVFSAWVLWHRDNPDRSDAFDWKMAEWSLRVPFIRALYEEVATPSKLGPLGLVEVLDWTAGALNRVDRESFFKKFQDEHAVQYFYEPFLESFDPELRKELGVWYTPPEIVQYQVARVDTVLREELGLADGLADPNVIVLDPVCGTGAYLVEVLKRIAATLKAKGGDALIPSDLKRAAMTRIFGFEILPAPFVVSHLQLGLMLNRLGAPLSTKRNERVGVYLTNSLTGWEPREGPKQHILPMPELEEERDAADSVKREAKILVILGNPPYNAFAGVSPKEEQGLVEPYKQGLKEWGITKNYLDDLYVRFFRLAERRIAEMTGRGVVSFISNFSYLGKPSFVVMRQRFHSEFDKLWFDCMNGDSRETGKLTPEGKPDPSVFSTKYNRAGIRVGTAVSIFVRKEERDKKPIVRFRHFWGVTKRQDLLASLSAKDMDAAYTGVNPCKDNQYSFRPEEVSAEYRSWPKVPDLGDNSPYLGLNENRRGALQEIDRDRVAARMQMYVDAGLSWDQYKSQETGLTQRAAGFDPELVRKKVQQSEPFSESRVRRYLRRPFDVVWAYISDVSPLWNRSRPELRVQLALNQQCFITRPSCPASPEGVPVFSTRMLGEQDAIRGHAYYFPVMLAPIVKAKGKKRKGQPSFLDAAPSANLSAAARAYLAGLGVKDPDAGAHLAGLIWMHLLSVGYSPAYLAENADGIRRDWPRVPFPDSRKVLEASAELGRQVAALLDTEADVPGVTAGKIEAILRTVSVLTKVGGGALDLGVTAGWGHAGKGGVTMPGKGRIVRRKYENDELDAIAGAAKAQGLSQKQALALLGPDTRDVYLNDMAYWKNVPANVWEYYIGGYQVIKKWLSYREQELLGRPLSADEAREVMNMTRRLAAIVLLQPALDENYRRAKSHTYQWPNE